jgi:hypothetical protein
MVVVGLAKVGVPEDMHQTIKAVAVQEDMPAMEVPEVTAVLLDLAEAAAAEVTIRQHTEQVPEVV